MRRMAATRFLRGNALAGMEYRYPFIASTGHITHVVEPIGQIIGRPDSVGDQSEIPNEDALSLVFDDTILFDIDKFSGYDRIETGTRANVGVRYTAQLRLRCLRSRRLRRELSDRRRRTSTTPISIVPAALPPMRRTM